MFKLHILTVEAAALMMCILTFFFHVDLQAFLEPARLALVSPSDIDDAVSIFFANIVQVPANDDDNEHECLANTIITGAVLHGSQPPNASFEKSPAAVTRGHSIMFAAGFVTAHFAQHLGFLVQPASKVASCIITQSMRFALN